MIYRLRTRLLTNGICLVLTGASVPAFGFHQNPQRARKATPAATTTPTPSPTTIPSPVQGAKPSPSPTPSPMQPRTATTTTSLAELRTRIVEILRKPELAPAMVAVKVASLDTGRTLFEENANKLLRPASNMKLYTVSTALDRLSPDFRFTTSVYVAAKPDAAGMVHGNLIIYGRGDP